MSTKDAQVSILVSLPVELGFVIYASQLFLFVITVNKGQLFTEVDVNSGGYLPSSEVNIYTIH